MKVWKASVASKDKEGKEAIIDLEFVDYYDATNTNIILKTEYFQSIIEKSKNKDNYHLSGGLVKLSSPEGEDFSKHSFFLILGLDTNNMLLGILLGELEEHDFKFVGFYPPFLQNELEKEPDMIRGLPVLLLDKEDIWQSVNIIAPSIKQENNN